MPCRWPADDGRQCGDRWCCWGCAAGGVLGNPDAKRLYDDLMSSYNRLIRPVSNNSDTLTVKMGLKLSQLMTKIHLIETPEMTSDL
ncbi:neur_chan_LBD domain-containing protein [Trichonephila inaurata madagascariensis]|uniref:Neur_chan_LBD domain-containing protein n=1 Tax=Trichonephila inaurata madagascariensis TaxID=2747483 RepID=A0A8X6XXG6_9ARAC|nr:neur_chan_LBD domain-containing protein [Trichonephila inaurata madagascariensis]